MNGRHISQRLVWRLAALLVVPLTMATAQEAADYFRANCASCHTIGGGRLAGPDLKNVGQRKDRAWLTRFLQDPKGVIDSGDPYALELQRDARGAIMPALPTMTKARAEALLDLIEAESKLEKSQFVGVQVSDRPFTPQDVEMGRQIFLGSVQLKNGGPSSLMSLDARTWRVCRWNARARPDNGVRTIRGPQSARHMALRARNPHHAISVQEAPS
jgi:mono/diheme cytochrome c family protein